MAMGCAITLTHLGVIMIGSRSTSDRIISNDRLPEPITTDARNSSDRHAGLAEDSSHLVPAAEVGRECLFVAAQSSQVDDAPHPCSLRCLAEVACGGAVSFLERAVRAHRVH